MAAYAYTSAGTEVGSTTLTTLSATMPTGGGGAAIAAGDVVFLLARSQTESVASTHSVPAGWNELGSIVRSDAGSGFVRRYGAIQLWWKVAGSAEPSASVTLNNPSSSFSWRVSTFTYRAVGGALAKIVGACIDDTTGSTASTSYTAPPRTSPVGTVILVVAQNRVSGTIQVSSAQSFTVQLTLSSEPATRVLDRAVNAGTITLPSFGPSSSFPWMSKSLVLDRDPNSGEWGVDRIAW